MRRNLRLKLHRSHSPKPPTRDRTDLEGVVVNGSLKEIQVVNRNSDKDEPVRSVHTRLYYAALKGDWKIAKTIFLENMNYVRERITKTGETVLHVAAAGKNTTFVRKLVEMLDPSDLELRNERGSTSFCYAAISGVVENARVMMQKNHKLPTIRDHDKFTPIQLAALNGHKKMVSYLYEVTPFEGLAPSERIEILDATVRNDIFDVALKMIDNNISIATAILEGDESLLRVLARKPMAVIDDQEGMLGRCLHATCDVLCLNFNLQESAAKKKAGQLFEKILTECLTLPDAQFFSLIRRTHILHYAAKEGNAEFLTMILRKSPDLLWELNEEGHSIFHVAVLHRQERVFNIIYNIGVYKDLITSIRDRDGNNILHLAAKVKKPNPSKDTHQEATSDTRPPLNPRDESSEDVDMILPKSLLKLSTELHQVRRDVTWFEELKRIVPSSFLDMGNKDDKTPEQIFKEQHTAMLKNGVKSIRESAKTCLVVAALISTMSFTAAIKLTDIVPSTSNDGYSPVVYRIFDAAALLTSILSIIMFLYITSCYTEDDFASLSLRLLIGLATLCFSIGSMLVVCGAAFLLMYTDGHAWELELVSVLCSLPVALVFTLYYEQWFVLLRTRYVKSSELKLC
ncbi:ankyrin repeat-containing protein NPR4-like isoform X1 [Ipomoea triloba]|uniref:ankyrin repeat-containing protein NPR4-like isoform X1 n=1 Tax=Ipomoea triloba TaxID=35885 RepID=UPI00125DCF65|nr:ankyrin repeat-containing protein NPR4-like isoform X1 [Ipomoea triloba]